MKKIWNLLLLAPLFLAGCEQNQIDTWEDNGRIGLYFFVPDNGTNESDPVNYLGAGEYDRSLWTAFCNEHFPDSAAAAAAMNFYSQLALSNYDSPAYYWGEGKAFEADTVTLVVGYTGVMRDGFAYRLKSWPDNANEMACPFTYVRDSLTPADVPTDALYFEPGVAFDTIHLLMVPEEYGTYNFQVGFDSTEVQVAGIAEWNRWNLTVNYSYDLDAGLKELWKEHCDIWFGEFSQNKHAFLQTTVHLKCDQTFMNYFRGENYNAADVKTYIWQLLHDALDDWNAGHPDDTPLALPAESDLPV